MHHPCQNKKQSTVQSQVEGSTTQNVYHHRQELMAAMTDSLSHQNSFLCVIQLVGNYYSTTTIVYMHYSAVLERWIMRQEDVQTDTYKDLLGRVLGKC